MVRKVMVKGRRKCPCCGYTDVPDGLEFCISCGAPMSEEIRERYITLRKLNEERNRR